MLPLTQSLLHAPPTLHSAQPLPPPLPNHLKVPTLTFPRDPRPAFEVIKHPEPVRSGRKHDIDQGKVFAEEERPFRIHLAGELLEVVEELGLLLSQAVFALVLQEAVVGGDDARADILLALAHTTISQDSYFSQSVQILVRARR